MNQRRRKNWKLLWITDPWSTLDHPNDTTLRWAQEAFLLGVSQYWCDVKSIRIEKSQVLLNASPILSADPKRSSNSFKLGDSEIYLPHHFNTIQYRTDPPVDLAYLHPLQMLGLGLAERKTTELVNPLNVLVSLNEKMEPAALNQLMAPSLVSSDWNRLLAFGKSEKRTVLKPLHLAQSKGIELLKWTTRDEIRTAQIQLHHATSGFTAPVMLQRYLERISEGETRLWFVDGKLLAYVKKLPIHGDFRVNIDQGSLVQPVELTREEKLKSSKIARHLRDKKIKLAAVDVIDGYVTDFNFTSPGLIPQMESVLGKNLSRPIIQALTSSRSSKK